MSDNTLPLKHGHVYRGRLYLPDVLVMQDGTPRASLQPAIDAAHDGLVSQGFASVRLYPTESGYPASWPAADRAQPLRNTWTYEATWKGNDGQVLVVPLTLAAVADKPIFLMSAHPLVTATAPQAFAPLPDAPAPGQNRDRWARDILLKAWALVHPHTAPTRSMLQAIQAVARLEAQYGLGWTKGGVNSGNWGAVQCCMPDASGGCPPSSFGAGDSAPTSSGQSRKYQVCFKAYASNLEGAADLIRLMTTRRPIVWDAGNKGDLAAVSSRMYDTTYYQGFGKTREERIRGHITAMLRNLQELTKAIGEPQELQVSSDQIPEPYPTKTASKGPSGPSTGAMMRRASVSTGDSGLLGDIGAAGGTVLIMVGVLVGTVAMANKR